MTGKERIAAILAGRPLDRVPHFPFAPGFCARNVGDPIETIHSEAEKSYAAQQMTFAQYGVDWGPIYGYASYGTWEAGGEVEMPPGDYRQAPAHRFFPVKAAVDLERLVQPDVHTAGCLPIAMAFSRLQQRDGVPISVVMGGPFTIAGNICPVETLCRWIVKKPELARRVLRLATDHLLDIVGLWVEAFGAGQVIPQFRESLATHRILSPRQFGDFVQPCLVETGERIERMGVGHVLYHIGGEQDANLPMWAEVPMGDPGLCSFGAEIDLDQGIDALGQKAVIIGNLDPNLLLSGKPEAVTEGCRQLIEKGRRAPRGFMCSAGCELAPETPGYHLYRVQQALECYGGLNA